MAPLQRQIAIRKLKLPWYARLIAYDLAARANPHDRCYPLQITLAKDNGVSLATVQRAVAHLREIKAIRVEISIGQAGATAVIAPGEATEPLEAEYEEVEE